MSRMKFFTVQRWWQYKLGNAPMSHDKHWDKTFEDRKDAEHLALTADSGISGDTRYRYKIVESDQFENSDLRHF